MWTLHPLALRVAFSPGKSLSNSPSFAQGETRPLSNIDSEVGQEPRGWELGYSHRGASRPLETEVGNTVSRMGVKLLKTDVLLIILRHETNVWPNTDICECRVRGNFRDLKHIGRIWCNCTKEIFLLMKDFIRGYIVYIVSSQGDKKWQDFFLKALGVLVTQRFNELIICLRSTVTSFINLN